MKIHLFGTSTPTGEALHQLVQYDLLGYSRKVTSVTGWLHPADLNDPEMFQPADRSFAPAVWISFAPIWLFAPFMQWLSMHHPERLQGLLGVITCSSSSVITKRFAANRFDRELVSRLTFSEDQLLATCDGLEISCQILRPTLIYGRVGKYVDKNLSRLINLMRILPILPLPADTGQRQPIHASQLAAVVLELVNKFGVTGRDQVLSQRIALGGDSELSYEAMLRALQQALPHTDKARRCLLLPLPNRMFQAAAAPLLLQSPKSFEAMLRISADLSGFIPCHHLLGEPPRPFPLIDLP